MQQPQPPPVASIPAVVPKSSQPTVNSNFDLLSGLDFSAPVLESILPILQPMSSSKPAILQPTATQSAVTVDQQQQQPEPAHQSTVPVPAATAAAVASVSSNNQLSQDPSLAGLNWNMHSTDTASNPDATVDVTVAAAESLVAFTSSLDPFRDPATLKWFHREVERYEKSIESMNVKTLNGTTALDTKWKELQDLLVGWAARIHFRIHFVLITMHFAGQGRGKAQHRRRQTLSREEPAQRLFAVRSRSRPVAHHH